MSKETIPTLPAAISNKDIEKTKEHYIITISRLSDEITKLRNLGITDMNTDKYDKAQNKLNQIHEIVHEIEIYRTILKFSNTRFILFHQSVASGYKLLSNQ